MTKRLELLGQLYMKQTDNLAQCNVNMLKLNEWLLNTEERLKKKGDTK